MFFFRLFSALAVISFQVSCALVETPAKLGSGMLNAIGRSLHLSSDNAAMPERFKLESRDVKQSVAMNASPTPEPDVAGPMIAQR